MLGKLVGSLRGSLLRIGSAVVLAGGLAPSADAAFNFNPTGDGTTGNTFAITGLGFGPGNVLAQGAAPGGVLAVGQQFTLYYQTHLTSLVGPSAPPAVPGLNSTFQITEVGTFQEMVTGLTTATDGSITATFQLVNSANNSVKIYENNAVVFNDANGTGFNAGQVIATLTPSNLNSSQFTNTTPVKGTTTFNQVGVGNNSGTGQAANGSGSTNLNLAVNSFNAAFFNPPTGQPMLTSSIFNSNLVPFFDTVAPSLRFTSANQAPNTAPGVTPVIGAINGVSGPDVQFKVSGFDQSFNTAPAAVPEPASIAMTVLGLGGMGLGSLVARRRRAIA